MKKPLVSFMIPAYNASKTIEQALRAIDKLHYQNKEVIVIDDGSTDDTFDIAKRFAKKHSYVHVFRLPENYGRGFARQFALSKAKGELLAFMDSDGWITNARWVEEMSKHLKGDTAGAFSLSNTRNPQHSVARYWSLTTLAQIIEGKKYPTTGTGNVLVRADALKKSGARFDERLDAAEDHDFFSQLHDAGYWFAYEPKGMVDREQPESFVHALKKRVYYFKWHGVRQRLKGNWLLFFFKSLATFAMTPVLALHSLYVSALWFSKTKDVAVFWHVPMQTIIALLAPFIALQSAFAKTR
ncbi:MAG TPA: glycosyltransferase family 2 protein [Candidatus Norongarragalinales archaeon]|nr:glycosyltransferase family 2 protein [Candidatus Norongarragalinales archaeon]